MTTPAPPAPAIMVRLPNARAGEPYDQALVLPEMPGQAEGAGPSVIPADNYVVPAGLALSYGPVGGRISGVPTAAGDHSFDLDIQAQGNPARRVTVQLLVNPDPRTLWKNLASDPAAPYWRPGEDCVSLRGSTLRIFAASKRGRSHAHVGSFRDDDVRVALVAESGWAIAAVADGAGSARYSREGAALICAVARERLSSALGGPAGKAIDVAAQAWHDAHASVQAPGEADTVHRQLHHSLSGIVGHAAYYAAKAIMEEADSRSADLQATFKDYASTAQIAICKRYPFGTLCAAYWVGDGAVGIYSRTGGITLLGDVDSGEYSGQTRFLEAGEVTEDALLRRTRFAIVPDMTALVLMTDGVTDPKFETEARLSRAADWDALWADLSAAVDFDGATGDAEKQLLAWLDFWSQGNHDDRTIAIIQ